MAESSAESLQKSRAKFRVMRLASRSGLAVELNPNGSLRRMDCGDTLLNLFIGNEVEGGPANLYLRRHRRAIECQPLLGPRSATRFSHSSHSIDGAGSWGDISYTVALVLADSAATWFWHVSVKNTGSAPVDLDLIYAQDVALAPYGTVRLNEYYVSQYVDHTPLDHTDRGCVVASRQNLASGNRNPWCVIGSLRRGKSYATDAMQVHGLASRAGAAPVGIAGGLPGGRLQHEHSMVAIQDEMLHLAPGASASLGFFGWYVAAHPSATSAVDLDSVDRALALPEKNPPAPATQAQSSASARSLFSSAPLLATSNLSSGDCDALFGPKRRHEEADESGQLLSFFHGPDRHVVLREKELRVTRPHGHLLRTGRRVTPDETALTSTVWMNGVFHSMLTQGHVSFNRLLSTTHSYLGLFRSQGQRVFVEIDGGWQLLDIPSAFEMAPDACRWIYRHARGLIEVRSEAHHDTHQMSLSIDVREGSPARFLICHHVALNGDDGSVEGAASWRLEGSAVAIAPGASTELALKFPRGDFRVEPQAGTTFERVGGDELLFADSQSRQQPYVCIVAAAARSVALRIKGQLIAAAPAPASGLPANLQITAPATSSLKTSVAQFGDIVPWFVHNALIHYLSPRGLEQYSGGGWGTRDVSQGPVELLLAFDQTAPVRDLLVRVMSAQSPDGDWPQWFMFFERERTIRAGDSHGDIVFWPVLAFAQYLIASGDAGLLDERVPYYATGQAEQGTMWQHVERALAVIGRRVVQGTALAAYGHGDWNDALQPVDPSMREHMCSAWTVTLHHQTLTALARALRTIGRAGEAGRFEERAQAVQRDLQQQLLVDDVLTGYALFDGGNVRYLLHPRDETSGVRYSSLAMIHAILEDMLTPEQTRAHLKLIDTHLSGPDGVRLFDRPMPYHGGPQRFFQRAESATFFGREIGLMYMHAHLRYAQALAHVGEAERFFHALCQANPIGIRSIVPTATLRQANCYYSSSDAAFKDRYQANAEYDRVARGEIAFDGGWRVYSSGAGIALSLIVRRFLGLSVEATSLCVDPVIPAALNGLRVRLTLLGREIEVVYDVKGSGCGVTNVEINGHSLQLAHEQNPHRKGAAKMQKAEVVERFVGGDNVMRISVGT